MLKDQLRHIPGLATIRAGGEIVRVGQGRSRYADAARAVEALEPDTIECLDETGAVLRVLRLRPADDATADAEDSDTDLVALARVLGDIADRAAQRHEAAYRVAFESQTQLVRVIADRLTALERAWQRVIMTEYQRAAESAADTAAHDTELDGIMGTVMSLASASAGKKKDG